MPSSFYSRYLKPIFVLAILLLAIPLAGCASSQSILEPATSNARQVTDLFYFIFYVALAIFIVVEVLLIYFVIRFQRRSNAALPEQVHGNTPLEVGWTIAPALILAVVFFFTVRTMQATSVSAQPASTLNVRVIGHQWWWEFQYPDLKIVTADELHVPAGQVVSVTLVSDNVIHSFWVPQLMGKTDVVPDHENKTWLRADAPGVYRGQCAEFCGAQHAHMLFQVVAQTSSDFDAWTKQQQAPPAAPAADAARGKQVFESNACIGCHTIEGTKGQGTVGPNLTHFGSRSIIAAGVLDNTPDNLTNWIRNAPSIKPGNDMPAFPGLTDADLQALAAYLSSLR